MIIVLPAQWSNDSFPLLRSAPEPLIAEPRTPLGYSVPAPLNPPVSAHRLMPPTATDGGKPLGGVVADDRRPFRLHNPSVSHESHCPSPQG